MRLPWLAVPNGMLGGGGRRSPPLWEWVGKAPGWGRGRGLKSPPRAGRDEGIGLAPPLPHACWEPQRAGRARCAAANCGQVPTVSPPPPPPERGWPRPGPLRIGCRRGRLPAPAKRLTRPSPREAHACAPRRRSPGKRARARGQRKASFPPPLPPSLPPRGSVRPR